MSDSGFIKRKPPVHFLSARVTNRVEALAVWEVRTPNGDFDVPTLMGLARRSLAQHLSLSRHPDISIATNVIPIQVVLSIDDAGLVSPGTVSVAIEERYGRQWAEERQTDTHDRGLRLVLEAIRGE